MRILIAMLILGGPLLAQAGVSTNSAISISDEEEVRVGRLLAAQYVRKMGIQPTPQARKVDAYLQTVGDKLAAHAQRKLPYRFHYDPNPWYKGAFALPGGEIFVGAGILSMIDTEDQLAMVLGHEMEHVAMNQCRDRLVQEFAKQHIAPDSADKLVIEPFYGSYGHDGEFAADREGVRLAAAAGYSPEGAIRLLRLFVAMSQQAPNTPSESQANLSARIAQIEQLIGTDKLATPDEKPLPMVLP